MEGVPPSKVHDQDVGLLVLWSVKLMNPPAVTEVVLAVKSATGLNTERMSTRFVGKPLVVIPPAKNPLLIQVTAAIVLLGLDRFSVVQIPEEGL